MFMILRYYIKICCLLHKLINILIDIFTVETIYVVIC